MTLPKMILAPNQAGYSAERDADTLRAKLGGGPGRYRLDTFGAAATVTVQWNCNPVQYAYLEAFFGSVVKGSLPFLIDLILDEALPTEYQARLVPGTKRLTGAPGLTRPVGAQLEVKPIQRNADADNSLVALYGQYEDASTDLLDLLDRLVNVEFGKVG